MKILEKNCLVCGKTFEKPKWISLKYWNFVRKFCSRKCLNLSKLGNKNRLGISYPAWNKGLPGPKGKNSPSWKGDNVSYSGIHKWVVLEKGNPEICEHCGKTGLKGHKIHWANIDHKYKRDLKDWIRLCAKCHQDFDKLNNNK